MKTYHTTEEIFKIYYDEGVKAYYAGQTEEFCKYIDESSYIFMTKRRLWMDGFYGRPFDLDKYGED